MSSLATLVISLGTRCRVYLLAALDSQVLLLVSQVLVQVSELLTQRSNLCIGLRFRLLCVASPRVGLCSRGLAWCPQDVVATKVRFLRVATKRAKKKDILITLFCSSLQKDLLTRSYPRGVSKTTFLQNIPSKGGTPCLAIFSSLEASFAS